MTRPGGAAALTMHTFPSAVAITDHRKYAFRITCCMDENEDAMPTAALADILGKRIPRACVSTLKMDGDEIRIVLEAESGAVIEVFGRLLNEQKWISSSSEALLNYLL